MKVLITGGRGQLGRELQRTVPEEIDAVALGEGECDITSMQSIDQVVADIEPALIINAAAYTAVDDAESDPDFANQVNADGIENLARAAQTCKARIIHVSTDFVFDGESVHPYTPDSRVNPINAYGRSKAEGERRLAAVDLENAAIVRTSWVYSATGKNFVKMMLGLMRQQPTMRVVVDQIGCPTWAKGLAGAIWDLGSLPALSGIYHWTDSGVASWYDFSCAIRDEAFAQELLDTPPEIIPLATADYPTPAKRPALSVLDKTSTWDLLGYRAPHWRAQLKLMLAELKNSQDA